MEAHTAGALKVAEIIMNDKHKIKTDWGEKTVYGVADMIENESGMGAMYESLKSLVDIWERWAKRSDCLLEPLKRSIEMRVEDARAALARAEGRE